MFATSDNHPEVVKMLTDKGADLNARDNMVGYYYTCACSTHVLLRFTNKKSLVVQISDISVPKRADMYQLYQLWVT